MKSITITFALCALVLTGACGNDQPAATSGATPAPAASSQQTAAAAELTPEQLGELGAQIRKTPADAQRLLSERGLDEQKFEQAVRKVSEDPAAAKRYAESYKKASA